ncbi:hypothetical protein V6C27_08780 [Peptococcaceae bacterium 1198_IL3148]
MKTVIIDYPKYDYVSNTLEKTCPRGMDTEVFSLKCLVLFRDLPEWKQINSHIEQKVYGQ